MTREARAALALGLVLAAAAPAGAHTRSTSYSSWTLGPRGAHVELRMAALDVSLAQLDPFGDPEALARWATERLVARRAGRPCTVERALAAPTEDGSVVVTWDVACGGPPDTIASRLFDDTAPSHLHFARAAGENGAVSERMLAADDPTWTLATLAAPAAARRAGSSFADYVRLGVDHIRTGYDHLAFVLALLLLAGTLGEVATIVSAFTVAHSITLGAAVLGFVRPDAEAVEVLIGFSIALVAAENGWLLGGRDRATIWLVTAVLAAAALLAPAAVSRTTLLALALFSGCHLGLLAGSPRPARLRAVVAFAFGLVHGFGFAGVLAEMDLPRDRLVPALLGFNVGVELGQLAVVTLGWLALRAVDRRIPGARRRIAELGSAAICALGVYWFVTRGWG
jgi:hypothetical protein